MVPKLVKVFNKKVLLLSAFGEMIRLRMVYLKHDLIEITNWNRWYFNFFCFLIDRTSFQGDRAPFVVLEFYNFHGIKIKLGTRQNESVSMGVNNAIFIRRS